jgi:hypothetical protein
MVTVDWLSRILEKSLGNRAMPQPAVAPAGPVAVPRELPLPLPVRRHTIMECPHCHSRITDFELESG